MIYENFDIKYREYGFTGVEAVIYKKDRNAFQRFFRLGKLYSCSARKFSNDGKYKFITFLSVEDVEQMTKQEYIDNICKPVIDRYNKFLAARESFKE
jgi:esterase/lipase superfamily enzyme